MAALVTLDEYKEYMSINSNTHDARQQGLIDRISDLVRVYCNDRFTSDGTDKESFFFGIYNEIYLKESPIQSITSLEVITEFDETTGVPVYATWLENDNTDGTGFYIDAEEAIIYTMGGQPFSILLDFNRAVKLTDVAGVLAGCSIDSGLKQAVLDIIKMYDKNETTTRSSNMGSSVDFAFTPPALARDFPPHIKRVLDLYRQVVTLGG